MTCRLLREGQMPDEGLLAAVDLEKSFVAAADAGNKQKMYGSFRSGGEREEAIGLCVGSRLA